MCSQPENESEVAQSCPTLCHPVDHSLPGSAVHGIFQARILEWAAISFSRGPSKPRIEPRSPALQTDALPSESPGKPHTNQAGGHWHNSPGQKVTVNPWPAAGESNRTEPRWLLVSAWVQGQSVPQAAALRSGVCVEGEGLSCTSPGSLSPAFTICSHSLGGSS